MSETRSILAGSGLPFVPNRLVTDPETGPAPARILAAAGPYCLAIDLAGSSTLGTGLVQRVDRPERLGLPGPVAADPAHASLAPYCHPRLSFGPCYKEADAAWVALSGLDSSWCDIAWQPDVSEGERLAWSVEYRIGGGPTLWESYVLSSAGLEYETRIEWVIGGFRLHLPLFVTNGESVGVPRLRGAELSLRVAGQRLHARALDPSWTWELDATSLTNRWGTYQLAILQGRSAQRFAIHLTLE